MGEESHTEETKMEGVEINNKRRIHDTSIEREVIGIYSLTDDDEDIFTNKPEKTSTPKGSRGEERDSRRKLKIGHEKKLKTGDQPRTKKETEMTTERTKRGKGRGRGKDPLRENTKMEDLHDKEDFPIGRKRNPVLEFNDNQPDMPDLEKGEDTFEDKDENVEDLSPEFSKFLKALENSKVLRGLIESSKEIKSEIALIKKDIKNLNGKVDGISEGPVDWKLVKDLKSKIDKLEPQKLESAMAKVQSAVTSFADAAKITKVQNRANEADYQQKVTKVASLKYALKDTNRFKLLIQADSKDAPQEAEEIRVKVTKKIPMKKIAERKGNILAVRKLKNAICIEATAEKKAGIVSLFKEDLTSDKLEVKEVTRDVVTVKIATVPREMEDKEIIEGISEGLENVPFEKIMENINFLRRKNARQWGRSLVYARIGGDIADRVIKKKEFFMGYSGRVQISPAVCVMSCSTCGDFSHSKKFCTMEKRLCFKCAKDDHEIGKCKIQEVKCILCTRRNKPAGRAYASSICPLYREAIERQLAREGRGLGDCTMEEYLQINDES